MRSARQKRAENNAIFFLCIALGVSAFGAFLAYLGFVGQPIPGHQVGKSVDLWRSHGPGARSAASYTNLAGAFSCAILSAALIVTIVRSPNFDDAKPIRGLGPIQCVVWLVALGLVVAQWIRGDRYSNYEPASQDIGNYVVSVCLDVLVIAVLVGVRIAFIREERKERRPKSGRARTPRE